MSNYQLTSFLSVLFFLCSTSVWSKIDEQAPELMVYKTPSCGCCVKWIEHIEEQGFATQFQNLQQLSDLKSQFGIRPNYRSCHTAVSKDGYVFEGHVPAKFIHQFLKETHPNAIGLSVPAMPVGSPGMEVGDRFMPYEIKILYRDGTSDVYAKVATYDAQF